MEENERDGQGSGKGKIGGREKEFREEKKK